MIFYYSGCGNSEWVAKSIANKMGEQLRFIPQADNHYSVGDGEAVGFVFPVYSWAPAEIVLRFVEQLVLDRKPEYIFAVCTCGDEAGHTAEIFRKSLAAKGLTLDAAYSVQMPETYINLPGFQLDTAEGEAAKHKAAQERVEAIAEALGQRVRGVTDVTVGSMAALKSGLVKWLFNKVLISDKPFRATEACVGCGICAKQCPVGNIRLNDNNRPEWQHHCIGCMGCYHHCPQNAIHWGRQTQGKGQHYCKWEVE